MDIFDENYEEWRQGLYNLMPNVRNAYSYADVLLSTAYRPEMVDDIMAALEKNSKITDSDLIDLEMKWDNDFLTYRGISAVVGLVVGDALGVPVEFSNRATRRVDPVTDMRGYGMHNQPPGTWSDDSSMMIATLDWFNDFIQVEDEDPYKHLNRLDYSKLMDKFAAWMHNGKYTPYDSVFDIGITTSMAISNYDRGVEPLKCGGTSVDDNGNGSLMRIIPAALFFHDEFEVDVTPAYVPYIYNTSSLTHGHARSKLACLIYTAIVGSVIRYSYLTKEEIVKKAVKNVRTYLSKYEKDKEILAEEETYNRLWDVETFEILLEDVIRSTGYVVDTLEAAVWCFLTTDSYKGCVLKAVNLGGDTDTIGAVAGGLAGAYYGIESIPDEWVNCIPKIEQIMKLTKGIMSVYVDNRIEIVCGDKTYVL